MTQEGFFLSGLIRRRVGGIWDSLGQAPVKDDESLNI